MSPMPRPPAGAREVGGCRGRGWRRGSHGCPKPRQGARGCSRAAAGSRADRPDTRVPGRAWRCTVDLGAHERLGHRGVGQRERQSPRAAPATGVQTGVDDQAHGSPGRTAEHAQPLQVRSTGRTRRPAVRRTGPSPRRAPRRRTRGAVAAGIMGVDAVHGAGLVVGGPGSAGTDRDGAVGRDRDAGREPVGGRVDPGDHRSVLVGDEHPGVRAGHRERPPANRDPGGDPAAAASSPVGDRPSSMGGPGRLVRGSIRTTVTPVLAAHTAPSRLASAEGIRPTPEATRTRATCLPVAASTRSTVPSSMRLTVPASWLATHTAPAATASDAGPPPTGILAWAWRGRTGTGCGRGPTGGPIVAPASDSAYLDMRKLIDPGLAWAHRSTRRPLRTADGLTALPESLPGAVEPPHGGPPASARGTGPFRRPPARTAHATFTACRSGDDCVSSGPRSRGTPSTVSVLCISQPPDPGCPISWPPSPCGRLSRPPWPVVVPATTTCTS